MIQDGTALTEGAPGVGFAGPHAGTHRLDEVVGAHFQNFADLHRRRTPLDLETVVSVREYEIGPPGVSSLAL